MITVSGLSKNYGKIHALSNVSFSLNSNEVVALLGPNGAGKTTLLKIMTGLLSPDSGQVMFDDLDIAENRVAALQKVGYVPENTPLYNYMSVYEFLTFSASLRGINGNVLSSRLDEIITKLDLSSVINRRIGKLSKGFRHRVGIAGSIIHHPEILIMDEPTEGLDPNQKFALHNFIKTLAKHTTVILSTHIMEDVEALATRILVMKDGKLIQDTTPIRLKYLMPEQNISASFRRITTENYGGSDGKTVY